MEKDDLQPSVDLIRYGTILSIITDTEDKLLNELKNFYFTIDTVFLNPEGFKGMWQWMEGGLKRLLDLTSDVSEVTNPHRFHRMILIPHPSQFKNNFARTKYREIVRTIIHYHLWHGVVCYVIFVAKKYYTSEQFLRFIDFGSIGKQIVFDTSNYYSKKFKGMNVIEASTAEFHIKRCLEAIRMKDLQNYIQLYYDNHAFEHSRRPDDSQWQKLKRFNFLLYGGVCPGPECAGRITYGDSALDHIIPQGLSNNVLLNLRILCNKCNRNKWKLDTHELPFQRSFNLIPPTIATEEIREIISDKPPTWVNRYRGKPIDIIRLLTN